jgi:hypothetical protein
MTDDQRKIINEIAELFKKDDAFKSFYGRISLNIAAGECKNIGAEYVEDGFILVKETILPNKQKKS